MNSADLCYQCRKCSSGCPVAEVNGYLPHRVVRLTQLGLSDRLLETQELWNCVGCGTCLLRCPNGIDTGEIVDSLREKALASGKTNRQTKVPVFYSSFLQSVRMTGRAQEVLMLGLYKLRARDLFSDLDSGLKLFLKGKLSPIPSRIKGLGEVKAMFGPGRRG